MRTEVSSGPIEMVEQCREGPEVIEVGDMEVTGGVVLTGVNFDRAIAAATAADVIRCFN